MKNFFCTLMVLFSFSIAGAQTMSIINQCEQLHYNKHQQLSFLTFGDKSNFKSDATVDVLKRLYSENGYTFQSIHKENDGLGFTHEKFSVMYRSLPVSGAVVIVHSKQGKIVSMNGQLSPIGSLVNTVSISKNTALQQAQSHLKVKKLKQAGSAEEAYFKKTLNQPDYSFAPTIEPIIFLNGTKSYHAFKVSFYAEEPLFNGEVYIDAQTGELLGKYNKVCMIDVPATGVTQYNGVRNFTNDQFAGGYRLREVQRGQGIETYNMNNTTNYSTAQDVVNATTTWTAAGVDSTAIGAHWAIENVYDYLSTVHSRNSIDNNGFKLISYVHYGVNFANAFWNGQFMTYGDGATPPGFRKMAPLDVCGHEATHGLVQFAAALGQGVPQGDPDALNEAWADIIGTSVERFTLPANWDWVIGKDLSISGAGIRNIQNPNLLSNPDTYTGTNWDFQSTNFHGNGCVAGHWFYLLNTGGSGTNDLNNTYSVTPISFNDAERIAFRALTVYFTPSTDFPAARLATINAARDLFGACSNQVQQVIRAWYAVGVGPDFSGAANPNFVANNYFCASPATTSFANITPYGFNFNWSFGDGNTSTSANPIHTYTANGVYTVKLFATGCNNLLDSIVKTAYVTVAIPQTPTASSVNVCANTSASLTAAGTNIEWYSAPSATGTPLAVGNSFVTPTLATNTTYYLLSKQIPPLFYGGLASNSVAATSGTFVNSGAQSLTFDVISTCTLQSVVLYAQVAGSRVVSLRNAANNLITSLIVSLSPGANTVSLNFPLTVGQNYKLGLTAGSGQSFFVTTAGVSYPYQISGCITITGSSLGNSQYPWFYNWEVQKSSCNSGITSVNVNVNANPSPSLSVTNATVCPDANVITLNGSPAGGVYAGTGVSGAVFSPTIGAGVYPVTYNYTDGNGCSGSTQLSITVEACVSVKENSLLNSISVYPNPAHGYCFVKNDSGKIVSGALMDVNGKLILQFKSSEKEISFNVSQLAKGVYILKLVDEQLSIGYFRLMVD